MKIMPDILMTGIFTLYLTGASLLLSSCRSGGDPVISDVDHRDEGITLSNAQVQMAGVNIAEIVESGLYRELSLSGVLKVNENKSAVINSAVSGRIEKVYFRDAGEKISRGDKLYEIYSDEMVNTQKEFLTLISNNWNFSGKYEPSLAVENRLVRLGMLPSQVSEFSKSGKVMFRIGIHSQSGGWIKKVSISEGQYVSAGETLYELAGNENMWIEAKVYADEIHSIKAGMPAIAVVPGAGKYSCRIVIVVPSFEENRNFILVRALIDNTNISLLPGMFAELRIRAFMGSGIVIPTESVVSGESGDHVWILENGKFIQRDIITGLQSDDSLIVLSGLNESDLIVTSGVYLIDSESTLRKGIK